MRYSPHVKIISFHCSASIAKYAGGIPTWAPSLPISPEFIETKYLLSHPITSISNKFIQICRDPLKISDIGEQMRVRQDFRASFPSHGLHERFYQLIRSTAPCCDTCDSSVRLNHCKFYFAMKFLSFLSKLFISGFKARLNLMLGPPFSFSPSFFACIHA